MPGIVVGVDGSAHALRALEWAMREAAIRRADLTVLTVNPAMASPWTGRRLTMPGEAEAKEQSRQAVEQAVAQAALEIGTQQPVSVTVSVFSGFPAPALIDASRDADMIVIGSRGAGGFESLLLGSISSQVTHHAECPVVIVPSDRSRAGA
ncbi:MAG TPA: universal stress protein [Streptosporangiaceae bacterium]|nr:universal stress protein [Streptosporangiaceae bacterium]